MATVEEFRYPFVPELPLAIWDDLGSTESSREVAPGKSASFAEAAQIPDESSSADRERREHEVARAQFEEGRLLGIQEGRRIQRETHEAEQAESEKQRLEQAAALAERCAREQEHFLQSTEHEVVKLALAVAARILRHEAQIDPLFLSGAVRVALGQLSKSSKVRLRVPQADMELWSESLKYIPNLAVRPEVLAGEGMQTGDCILETEVGSVDLGARSQLSEIEGGFFDRAGKAQTISADPRSVLRYQGA